MSAIKYVCLSDLHLGEENSLLTNLKTASSQTDPLHPSPVLNNLCNCLKQIITNFPNQNIKPTLILNGDIIEMALTTTNEGAMVFERFIELIMARGNELFNDIIYIPGNHDHHIWEIARETQYAEYIISQQMLNKKGLPIPWHITKIFKNPIPAYFLNKLINRVRGNDDLEIKIVYPNFGIVSSDNKKCVVFHHGHFIESLYQLMSFLRTLILSNRIMSENIDDIEAENFAWIDFFWSTMGRSGEVGKDVELIYEKIHFKNQREKLIKTLSKNIAKNYDIPYVPGEWLEEKVVKFLISTIVNCAVGERKQSETQLSEDAEKVLWKYVEKPLKNQILTELGLNDLPPDVIFVFGHTHKPFSDIINFKDYKNWVKVYNTGGWVVDYDKPNPILGGSIVLIDEDLNSTSIRMYNEANSAEEYTVKIEEAKHTGDPNNSFYSKICQIVKHDKNPWKSFSESVARAVSVRNQNIRAKHNIS